VLDGHINKVIDIIRSVKLGLYVATSRKQLVYSFCSNPDLPFRSNCRPENDLHGRNMSPF